MFGEALGAAEHYVDILAGRGVEWGLIGPRETDRLWERHVLNSVAVADVVPQGSTVIDVGSGAGFPGRAGNYSAIFDTDFSVLQKSRSLSSPISTAIPRKKPRGLKVEKVIAGWPVLSVVGPMTIA